MQRASVDFPQPVSPTRPERLAPSHLEADPVDGVHDVLAAAQACPTAPGNT